MIVVHTVECCYLAGGVLPCKLSWKSQKGAYPQEGNLPVMTHLASAHVPARPQPPPSRQQSGPGDHQLIPSKLDSATVNFPSAGKARKSNGCRVVLIPLTSLSRFAGLAKTVQPHFQMLHAFSLLWTSKSIGGELGSIVRTRVRGLFKTI